MKPFDATVYVTASDISHNQKVDVEKTHQFILMLNNKGFSASRQSDSWRIINKPECPIRVQLEFTNNGTHSISIIPLSSYTDSLEQPYPLQSKGIPHTATMEFETIEDIENAMTAIQKCFPIYPA